MLCDSDASHQEGGGGIGLLKEAKVYGEKEDMQNTDHVVIQTKWKSNEIFNRKKTVYDIRKFNEEWEKICYQKELADIIAKDFNELINTKNTSSMYNSIVNILDKAAKNTIGKKEIEIDKYEPKKKRRMNFVTQDIKKKRKF